MHQEAEQTRNHPLITLQRGDGQSPQDEDAGNHISPPNRLAAISMIAETIFFMVEMRPIRTRFYRDHEQGRPRGRAEAAIGVSGSAGGGKGARDSAGLLSRFGGFCYARAVGGVARNRSGVSAVPSAEVVMAAMAIRRPRWRVLLATAVVAVAAAAAGAAAVHAPAPAAHAVADDGVINAH